MTTLAQVLTSVRRYLDLEAGEERFLLCALATAVSRALHDEEPLWVFLIGPPGVGKSEVINLLAEAADLSVDELTRAGLLSWSVGGGKKARAVGLLTRLPPVALVTISDFSTVATMGDREARARMYGMLRVIYDGRVYRGIGGEPTADGAGAAQLQWSGHLTLLAGATPAMDAHTSVEAALGERWLTVRIPEASTDRKRRRANYVIDRQDVPPLRKEAQALAHQLVAAASERIPARLDDSHVKVLVEAALLCATARTGVPFEGQGRSRVAVGLPVPEEPTRLVGQLNRLARCLVALGLDQITAVTLACMAATDSVPLARMRAIEAIAAAPAPGATVSDVHRGLGRGNRWGARWELDALDAIGMIEVEGVPQEEDPAATRLYRLRPEWHEMFAVVQANIVRRAGVYACVARPLYFPLEAETDVGLSGRGCPTDAHTLQPTGDAGLAAPGAAVNGASAGTGGAGGAGAAVQPQLQPAPAPDQQPKEGTDEFPF